LSAVATVCLEELHDLPVVMDVFQQKDKKVGKNFLGGHSAKSFLGACDVKWTYDGLTNK